MADELCCGCAALASEDEYDLGLHVAAIFILFGVSAAGAWLPIVSKTVPFLSSKATVIEWLMSFGFGVVIATGFIHMINEGVEMLKNPCLGDVVESYESIGMAVVLVTVVLMHVIECESTVFFSGTNATTLARSHGHVHAITTPTDEESAHQEKLVAMDELAEKTLNKKLAILLFELGVVFHSVIIGIELGVTAGLEFNTLLAAICFHQFFEGIAIGGSALSAIDNSKHVAAMNMAYAVTTPLGLVIGITLRSTYSSTSVTALWVQGIVNCVAGGILLYTGLVELMTYQMTTNNEFLSRPGRQRFLLYLGFWMGAGFMALIGKWA